MYWFAHGGIESNSEKCLNQRNEGEEDVNDSTSPTLRLMHDRRVLPDEQKSPLYLNPGIYLKYIDIKCKISFFISLFSIGEC